MKKKKPVIFCTGSSESGLLHWIFVSTSVRLAGGKPIRVTIEKNIKSQDFDGLIIGGGANIHPEFYGENVCLPKDPRSLIIKLAEIVLYPLIIPFKYLGNNNKHKIERDRLELSLIQKAHQEKKPVLGICRGMQLINVYFEGSLAQDIYSKLDGGMLIESFFPRKKLRINKNSKLFNLIARKRDFVNALHLQSIEKVGKNLSVSAREPNGMIQALEHKEAPMLGVQWHPEYLIYQKRQRNLFKWLIKQAS